MPPRVLEWFRLCFGEDVQALRYCPVGTPRSPKWPPVRRRWIEAHPICELCDTEERLQVHHIYPVHLFVELELVADEEHLISLCRPHHLLIHGMDYHSWIPHARKLVAQLRHEIKRRQYGREA